MENSNLNDPIRIIIAEDQNIVRKGLIALLAEEPHLQVIGEAENGKELLELLRTKTTDIVLLDVEMPLMNGKEALELISKRHKEVRTIILSMYADTSYINEFSAMGACAYLPKGCDVKVLINAIETVHKEGSYILPSVADQEEDGTTTKNDFEELALTAREISILKEVCSGKTNKQIADIFSITHNTVDFHRGRIYKKTKCKNVPELVLYAVRHGHIATR